MQNILLMVPRLNIGGAETYTAMVAEALKCRGYNVYIASGGGALADKLKKQGIPNFWLPMRFSTDIAAFLLKRIIYKYNIDLIHANSSAAGITAVKFKQRYKNNIPVIYTAHGIFGNNKKEQILNKCDKIICVSNFVKTEAVKKGFDENKLITVYSGIAKNKFTVDSNDYLQVRHALNISDKAFVIALVARIKNLTNKGHIDMLHILKDHFNETQNWHLLIIGKGKASGELKRCIEKYHLKDRVHYLGHQVDVAKYTVACDAMVLPSFFETFGLALAEGMAMGKPGVAYSIGGIPEVIDDNITGFLADYKDENSLFKKLNILAADKKRCLEMGERAKNIIREKLSCEKMMDKLIEIYRESSSLQ